MQTVPVKFFLGRGHKTRIKNITEFISAGVRKRGGGGRRKYSAPIPLIWHYMETKELEPVLPNDTLLGPTLEKLLSLEHHKKSSKLN